ncbi:hypothetical protein AB0H88_05370 [Nonomuraea sp. NPDC050680]|uniref:hypothetical protein n=1 Tax=Nonomuraea sp. NPDC050680 TaxID=3154630 RepID=UPI003411A36D
MTAARPGDLDGRRSPRGAFDLRRFQVITDPSTVYLRAEIADLTPTFGSQIDAQLLDVRVQDPAVTARSPRRTN